MPSAISGNIIVSITRARPSSWTSPAFDTPVSPRPWTMATTPSATSTARCGGSAGTARTVVRRSAAMGTVQTVLGLVDANHLGPTLVHEHVLISYPGDTLDPTGWSWERAACIDRAVERMEQLRDHGVRTFVDPCPIDLGRYPELLAEVAQRSGMQIVCATGFYHEEIGIPWYWRVRTSEEIAELYMHEIEHGIGATGIKPGVIKIATFDPVGEHDRKVVAAAGMAAAASGLTCITH